MQRNTSIRYSLDYMRRRPSSRPVPLRRGSPQDRALAGFNEDRFKPCNNGYHSTCQCIGLSPGLSCQYEVRGRPSIGTCTGPNLRFCQLAPHSCATRSHRHLTFKQSDAGRRGAPSCLRLASPPNPSCKVALGSPACCAKNKIRAPLAGRRRWPINLAMSDHRAERGDHRARTFPAIAPPHVIQPGTRRSTPCLATRTTLRMQAG